MNIAAIPINNAKDLKTARSGFLKYRKSRKKIRKININEMIKEDDSYIRTEFKYGDGSTIYLNPIVRYSGDYPASTRKAEVNKTATLWLRIAYFLIILTLIYLFRRKKLSTT